MATPYQATGTLTSRQREALVLQLRADHVPVRVIATQLGISPGRVSQIHQKACSRIPAEALHTIRIESSELAYRAIKDLLGIAENPQVSPRTRAEAWGQVRGWSESLRKLMGADAPQRREISIITEDAVNNAIKELTSEMSFMEDQVNTLGIHLH